MAGTKIKNEPQASYDDVDAVPVREAKASIEKPAHKKPQPLDKPDIQAEIVDVTKLEHKVELLDGSTLTFKLGLTVREVFAKRLDGRIMILVARLADEVAKFPQLKREDAFSFAALNNEELQNDIIFIVAKLCGVKPSHFDENISGVEIGKLGLVLVSALANNTELIGKIFPKSGSSERKN